MAFDRKTLVIPDNTKFEERIINTSGDVVVGDRSMLQYSIKTNGRIFIGEHAIIDGNLDATNDVRIDIFSNIGGDITSGGDAFLGEKVKVQGKLSLKGDLDVGDSVEIENGFEAKGWINIRSPIPIVIYIFIYLSQLLKLGHSEEINRILEELEDNEGATIPISESFLFVPNNTIMGKQKARVECNLRIGKQCKILGNYDIKGDIFVDDESNVYGSLDSTGEVACGKKVKIHGNVTSQSDVHISDKVYVVGDVSGERIFLAKSATVNGTLLAKKGISFIDASKKKAAEKIKRFESDIDVVDEVKEMLE